MLLSLCGFAPTLWAQLSHCIGFSNLEEGYEYNLGYSPFYEETGVSLSLDSFLYLDGGQALFGVEAGSSFFNNEDWGGEGIRLLVSNTNVVFDFADYPYGVDFLCLRFFDGGGQVNIRINGVWRVFEDFPNGGFSFGDGVFVDVGNSVLCVNSEAPITDFAIGGQEFVIDNICFSPLMSPPGCISLDMESNLFTEVEAQFFPNGVIYYTEQGANFSVNRTYLNLPGITPNGHVQRLSAAANPGFGQAQGSYFQHVLALSNVSLAAVTQVGETVSFDYYLPANSAAPNNVFYLKVNNSDIRQVTPNSGTFTLANNFNVIVTPSLAYPGTGTVTISPLNTSGRVENLIIGGASIGIDNFCTSGCGIGNLLAVQSQCEGVRSILTVNYSGYLPPNASMQLYYNGILYTGANNTNTFPASSFPRRMILPADYVAGDTVQLSLVFAGNSNCSASTSIVLIDCDAICDNFEVNLLDADIELPFSAVVTLELNSPAIGQNIWISQPGANVTTQTTYDNFGFPLVVQLILDPSLPFSNMMVEDRATGCTDTLNLNEILVPTCDFEGIETSVDCLPNGNFYIDLDFNLVNSMPGENPLVVIYQGAEVLDSVFASEVPVRLGPFDPSEASGTITLTLLHPNGSCVASVPVSYNCPTTTCPLQSASADLLGCSNAIYFAAVYTQLVATSPNPNPNLTLRIRSTITNAVVEVPYEPAVSITMPLPNVPYDRWEVCLGNLPDCCRIVEISLQGCPPEPCDLGPLQMEATCQNDGSYNISLDFEYTNPTQSWFDLYLNGESYGFYSLNQLPLTLTGVEFPANTESVVFRACINDNADCCTQETLHLPDCGGGGVCGFQELVVEPYACDGGQFRVDVAFDNPSPGALGFYIFADGAINGPFAYGQPFYTVGPLNGTNTSHNLLLLDIANPACYRAYSFDYTCTDDCAILQVAAEVLPCEEEGEFFLQLDIEAVNTGESFLVVGTGQTYGPFNYNNIPDQIGPFQGEWPSTYDIAIIDLQHPNCVNFAVVTAPNCAPCNISNFAYEVECTSQGVSLTVNFDVENPVGEFYALYLGEQLLEYFPYTVLPLTLTLPYEYFEGAETIRVEDILQESCGQTLDFELPCCRLTWPQSGVRAESCNDNGTFGIWVAGDNTPNYGANLSDSLIITYAPAGSTLIETITVAYDDLPIELGPLNGTGQTPYFVTLADQSGGCSQAFTLAPVSCDNVNCIEFTGLNGIYGPASGAVPGDTILVENSVHITYEPHPFVNCLCNVFGLPNTALSGVTFGMGQVLSTQGAGFGIDLRYRTFTSFSFDFYYTGGQISLSVNGADTLTANHPSLLPAQPANGVQLEVNMQPGSTQLGTITFRGAVEYLHLYTTQTSAWDNLCFSNQQQQEEVWPGDANTDNLANHFDLLNIGVAYESNGPARATGTQEWAAQMASPWSGVFANGVNYKHADCNGDGMVNEADRQPILTHYGLTHGVVSPFTPLPSTDLDPPVFVQTAQVPGFPAGAVFEIPIVVGTEGQPVQNIYGIAFEVNLNPAVIDMGSLELVYPTSWLGDPGVNLLQLDYRYNNQGKLEIALVRNDHNNVSGYGPVAYLRGIIDDIVGIEETSIGIEKIKAIDAYGQLLPLRNLNSSMALVSLDEPVDGKLLEASFEVFPNPTTDVVYFSNVYQMPAERVTIFDMSGRQIADLHGSFHHLSTTALPGGVYVFQIQAGGYRFSRRVVKVD